MSEHTKQGSKQAQYTYSWYLPAVGSKKSRAEAEERRLADSGMQTSTHADQKEAFVPAADVNFDMTGNQSGSLSSHLFRLFESIQVRGVAVLGWSAVAGVGAVLMLSRAGPFPGTQLAALAGTWAGISAVLWILPSKLRK
jgi:hypothetical protein